MELRALTGLNDDIHPFGVVVPLPQASAGANSATNSVVSAAAAYDAERHDRMLERVRAALPQRGFLAGPTRPDDSAVRKNVGSSGGGGPVGWLLLSCCSCSVAFHTPADV